MKKQEEALKKKVKGIGIQDYLMLSDIAPRLNMKNFTKLLKKKKYHK